MSNLLGPSRTSTYGRWAIWLMLIALLLLVFATLWLLIMQMFMQQPTTLDPSAVQATRHLEASRFSMLLMITMVSILLILVFVIGAYLLIKVGRAVASTDDRSKPTEYVDAWSQYRLTEDDIARATEEPLTDRGRSEEEPDEDADEGDAPPNKPGPRR